MILNHAAWEQFFSSSPDAIGSPLKLGDKVYTVIGVMPAGFEFPEVGGGPSVWVPLVPTTEYRAAGLA